MTAEMQPEHWLEFVASTYLDGFVAEGGAAIKFAVPLDEATGPIVQGGLMAAAARRGYLAVKVSATHTKVHMVDQLYFAIAEQIPWDRLARQVLVDLARKDGYEVPDHAQGSLADIIASSNAMEVQVIRNELRRKLGNTVYKRRALAKDFRVAMLNLCLAELSGGEEGIQQRDVITDWLTGRTRTIGAIKPYGIYTRIQRTNARYFLESLLDWVRYAGDPGLVMIVDIQRVTITRNPKDEGIFYSKAALLDTYEVLRQFIDGTDRLRACLFVVIPSSEFLDIDKGSRGIGAYEALMFRVYDEVRDRNRANPMASLARLAARAPEMSK